MKAIPSGLLGLAVVVALSCHPTDRTLEVTARIDTRAVLAGIDAGRSLVETHLAAHPEDATRLVAAGMQIDDEARPFETARLIIFESRDGGASFAASDPGAPGYDPWVAWPSSGPLVSWIGRRSGDGALPHVVFGREHEGAAWRQVGGAAGDYDHIKLSAVPATDIVLATGVFFDPAEPHDTMAKGWLARLEGREHQRPTLLAAPGEAIHVGQAAAMDGARLVLPVAFLAGGPGRGPTLGVWRSFDGGRTFDDMVEISTRVGSAKGHLGIAVDVARHRIYVARATGPEDRFDGIWLTVSPDAGATWLADTRVDDDRLAPGHGPALASVASNCTGAVAVSYARVTRGLGEGDLTVEPRLTWSIDGGRTFAPSVPLADAYTLVVGQLAVARLLPYGGHYAALAGRADGAFHWVGAGIREGAFVQQTARIVLGGPHSRCPAPPG